MMPHNAEVDLILRTDYFIPSGDRLDVYNSTKKLQDKIVVPLLKSLRVIYEPGFGDEIIGGPVKSLKIEGRWSDNFKTPA